MEPLGDLNASEAGVHHVKITARAAREANRLLKRFTAYNIGYKVSCLQDADKLLVTDAPAVFTRIAGQFPRMKKVKLNGICSINGPFIPGGGFWFPFADEERRATPQRDALQKYIKQGGAHPDLDSVSNNSGDGESEDDIDPWDGRSITYKKAKVTQCEEDDGGYDSDGSHISYGSDDFDLQI